MPRRRASQIIVNRSPQGVRHRERPPRGHAVRQDGVRGRCAADASRAERIVGEEFLPADDVILAIGQENAFPWVERDLGIEFDKWDVPVIDKTTFQSTLPGRCSSAAMRRSGPRTSSGRSSTATRPRSPFTVTARASAVQRAAAARHQPAEPQDGHARVVVRQRLHAGRAAADAARVAQGALQEAQHRGGARLHRRAGGAGSAALPQLRRADGVHREAVHRMRRLHRHLPGRLSHHHAQRRGGRAAHAPEGAGEEPGAAAVRVGGAAADRAGDGEGRGPVRALRAVRRALPDRGLGHAEVRAALAATPATRPSASRRSEPKIA